MYLEFFQLREFPFNITPDPKFLYFAASHRAAYDHLRYGILQRKGFIELTGEVGCGKSTLCRAVLENFGADIRSALILNPCLNGAQLLRAILSDFGLKTSRHDRLSQMETLNAFLLRQAEASRIVVLIIDEAQDMPPRTLEEVRLLSNLETTRQKLLQIVLAGQPELKKRLESPALRQMRQRITVRYHIPPLAENDVASYIEHRLRKAGAPPEVTFDDGALAGVIQYTGGIPRLINALCDYAMLAGYMAGTRRITADCVARAEAQLEGVEE